MAEVNELRQIRAIIVDSIPGADPTAEEVLPLTSLFLTDPGNFQVIRRAEEAGKLKHVSEWVEKALHGLRSLHPDVRRLLEHSFAHRAESETVRFVTDREPFLCLEQLETLLAYLHAGLRDTKPEVTREIETWPLLSRQAAENETWTKVRLVHLVRGIWERHTGQPAPKVTQSGRFANLLGELIDFHQFEWDVESTMRAWKEREGSAQNWGWERKQR